METLIDQEEESTKQLKLEISWNRRLTLGLYLQLLDGPSISTATIAVK